MKISKERIFIFLNAAIFSIVPLFTYKKPEGMRWWHFLLALSLIFLFVKFLWEQAENFQLSNISLILLQSGLVMHYFGTMHIFGTRGYNLIVAEGIRYDKLVHFVSSFAIFIVLRELSKRYNFIEGKYQKLWMILAVLGIGALVEIVEYIATWSLSQVITIQSPYDNSLQDMIADLLGALIAALF